MAQSFARRTGFLAGVLMLLAFGVAVTWFGRPGTHEAALAAPAEETAVKARTATVQVADVPIRIEGLGTVKAWSSVTVRPRIDGQLESVHFQEGRMVERGQLLAQLDDRIQKAQLAQAKAQRARDQAQLDNAREDLKRYEKLAAHSAIDRQTLDTQRAQVAAQQATVKLDDAQLQFARTTLDYTRLVAPLSGLAGPLLVDPGNQLRADGNDALVLINQVDPIAVSFTVPDTAYAQVRQAMRDDGSVKVQVFGHGGQPSLGEGRLVLIDNRIDSASATLRLKARLDNPEHRLWPGQSVDVRLVLGVRPDALLVPESAIQRGPHGLYVYVLDEDSRARVQLVQVPVTQDGMSVVAQGLQPGQRIVVSGQYKLRPGVRVDEVSGARTEADARSEAGDSGGARS